jgi:metal-dependent HD superfamily phosphatase/phosphodiesterase
MLALAETDWRPKPGPEYVSHGELVVTKVEDMQAFWRMWRVHFASKVNYHRHGGLHIGSPLGLARASSAG